MDALGIFVSCAVFARMRLTSRCNLFFTSRGHVLPYDIIFSMLTYF